MTVRMWEATKAPDTDADRKAWLTAEWAVVDEWIDLYRARSTRASRDGARAGLNVASDLPGG
jgi:hypothetical protein